MALLNARLGWVRPRGHLVNDSNDLTACSENFLREFHDLDDTIRRLQAYDKAGADVLFAPLLPNLTAVRSVCSSVTKPVNFMNGVPGRSYAVVELAQASVKRISVATSLYRAAMSGLIAAAQEIRERGTFDYLNRLQDINRFTHQ